MTLTDEQRRYIKNIWERGNFTGMTYLELERLYEWFLNKCFESGISPDYIDFEAEIDPSLSYYENQRILEDKIFWLSSPTYFKELEEIEYYKKKVEELERKLKEMEKIVPTDEIERLKKEVEEWKKKYNAAKKQIIELKKGGMTREEIEKMIKREMREVATALKNVFSMLLSRMKEYEEAISLLGLALTKKEKTTAEISHLLRYKPIVEVESDFSLIESELENLSLPKELREKFRNELDKMKEYKEKLFPLGFTIPEEKERTKLRDLVRTSYDKMMLMVEYDFPLYVDKSVVEELKIKLKRLWADMVRL